MLYRFNGFILNSDNGQLSKDNVLIDAEPQVITLLIYLAENRDRVISKNELIDVVWRSRVVSDASLNSRISTARHLVDDSAKAQDVIRTFSKNGYQFVAELEKNDSSVISTGKPSIAVLPFENLSDDPKEEYFARGVTEDIITGLSSYHDMRVIARSSSFAAGHQTRSTTEIGKLLNVQYLVEGSIRRNDDQIRITARLVDIVKDNEIWSQRYDRKIKDIFAVQDEVTNSIVTTLSNYLRTSNLVRAKRKNTESSLAYDHLLRGIDHYYKLNHEDNTLAIQHLEKAIELDPDYARALAWLTCVLGQGKYQRYYKENFDNRALELLKRAREMDSNDSEVFRILSAIQTDLGNHIEAEINLDRAISLNPNDSRILCQKCELLIWKGRPVEGLTRLDEIKQRDPMIEEPWWSLFGRAKFELKEYQSASESLNRIQNFQLIDYACLAASFAYSNQSSQAREIAAKIIKCESGFSITEFVKIQPYLHQKNRDHLADGLYKTGLPE